MKIQKKYLSKHLHDIAIEQIADKYIKKGYSVNKEERLDKYQADLIARKENEQIVIEVKTGKLTPDRKKHIEKLADYVRSLGDYKFLVVIARPPREKKLEIDNLEQLISESFHVDMPSELDELSTHTRPDEITDIDIDEIKISGKSIFVIGDGVVSVELQFGSDGDQSKDNGFKTYDNFPFEFELTLEYVNGKLEITEYDKLEVDTTSYYE